MVLIAWAGWPPRRATYQISLRVIRPSDCLLEVSQLLHGLEYGLAHTLSMQTRCRVFFGHEGPVVILVNPYILQTAILRQIDDSIIEKHPRLIYKGPALILLLLHITIS